MSSDLKNREKGDKYVQNYRSGNEYTKAWVGTRAKYKVDECSLLAPKIKITI